MNSVHQHGKIIVKILFPGTVYEWTPRSEENKKERGGEKREKKGEERKREEGGGEGIYIYIYQASNSQTGSFATELNPRSMSLLLRALISFMRE